MNKIIYEFDPVIYPTRVWVGVNVPFEYVKDKFYALDSDMERGEITLSEYKPKPSVIARTYVVANKESCFLGTLVIIWRPINFNIKSICHESVHCADFICEQFGIKTGDFDDGEPYAYLIGWIAECIDKVKRNKI